ncbi:MAG TPA: OmpA family protein [Flavobacteriales bacterium]|nr:OmpA family protein [Flavobacteriales bacterium]
MNKKLVALCVIALVPVALLAQEDKNLVKNPGFEGTTGKIKRYGAIASAKDWKSPTGQPADLYSKTVKGDAASAPTAPENMYGKEDPMEGNNYAGFVGFAFGDKQPRSYITTELIGPLKEGVQYCISYQISLSDQSKYACTNIGAHLHKKEMGMEEKNSMLLETHMKHPKNKVITQSFGWEQVCNTFTAKGGEKYITIGNFSSTKDTKSEKIPKPKGSTAQQYPIAYYYIDNVQVFQLDSIQECQCDVPKLEKAHVNYEEISGSNKVFTPEEQLTQNKIQFDNMSTVIHTEMVEHLNKIIEAMNQKPEMKVDVIAHCDKSEYAKVEIDDRAKDLTKNRANAVIDFLVKGGISKDRFTTVIKEDQEPISTDMSELGQAKNRRVEFKAK